MTDRSGDIPGDTMARLRAQILGGIDRAFYGVDPAEMSRLQADFRGKKGFPDKWASRLVEIVDGALREARRGPSGDVARRPETTSDSTAEGSARPRSRTPDGGQIFGPRCTNL